MEDEIDKKYHKIFRDINRIGEIVKLEDFFDKKEIELILNYRKQLKNNKNNTVWKEKIKNFAIESSSLTQEIFLNSDSPSDLISDIIITTKHSHLLKDALKRPLKDADYEYIALYRKKEITEIVNNAVRYSDGRERMLKEFHQDFINFLYKKHNDMFPIELAKFITDDVYMCDLLDDFEKGCSREISENEMAYIVGNENISESVRERAFTFDCNYFLIKKFPKSIINDVYESCIDFVFNTDEKDIENKQYYQDAKVMLQGMVANGVLDVDKEMQLYELVLRHKDDEEHSRCFKMFAKHSKYSQIINKIFADITNFNTAETKMLYLLLSENKNLSDSDIHMLSALMQPDILTKKNAINSIEGNLKAHKLILSKWNQMPDYFYDTYILAENIPCIKVITLNQNTPISVLQKIQKKDFVSDELKVFAMINEFTNKYNLRQLFTQFCDTVINPCQLSFSHLIQYDDVYKRFNEMCDVIAEQTRTLKNKSYCKKIIKIKENVEKEYEQYKMLKKYPQYFKTPNPKTQVYMKNFDISDNIKTSVIIPEGFKDILKEMQTETLTAIKKKLANELHDFVYVDNNDAEFYARVEQYTEIYNICEDIIKERALKTKVITSEVEQIANSMTEEDKEEFC